MTNIYIADDGTEFTSKKDCIVYENVLKVIETDNNSGLKQALITIAEYCHSQIDCWNCPIFISKGCCILQSKVPNYWLYLKGKENEK